jgi:hypothetical protein
MLTLGQLLLLAMVGACSPRTLLQIFEIICLDQFLPACGYRNHGDLPG